MPNFVPVVVDRNISVSEGLREIGQRTGVNEITDEVKGELSIVLDVVASQVWSKVIVNTLGCLGTCESSMKLFAVRNNWFIWGDKEKN